MQIPAHLKMVNVMHGNLGRGGYIYRYKDEAGIGIVMTATRKTRREAETTEWSFLWTGNKFANYVDLKRFVESIDDMHIELIKARYPYIRNESSVERERKCRLCELPAFREIDIATTPDGMDDWFHVDLCAVHLVVHPIELVKLLQERVNRRKTV